MINWHDPSIVLKDYIALIKLNHALAGIYIWETVFTAGFELDVLRRKRPYRWTIWLYLGTRYTGLLAFIFFFVNTDGPRLPSIHNRAFRKRAAPTTLSHTLICDFAPSGLTIDVFYDTTLETCIVSDTHKGLVNAVGVLVVDVVLLMTMLIGLLRCAHKSPNGIWKLLYEHCIIWIFLALITEIPTVVFLILNLNDAWNEMLNGAAITVISIGAARMYRSLSISLTECPL
ncbi:hypothetical protein F5148DRAFT_1282291 [Russula earlei]|uniref:Uncharacterized protein n=1 Tax=Russula earlei TaxID=71964 RepID=A0ACC0UED8_9AGAM|nr:hypothetical protein F5148DRAFT_1282291 [Russula earlei]